LVVAVFSMSYMLNSYREISSAKDGSYGLVALIDFVFWGFLWFLGNLYFPRDGKDYEDTTASLLVPAVPILRQIAKATPPLHFGAAAVDLLVGAAFMIAWILLPKFADEAEYPRWTRTVKAFLVIGTIYGLTSVTLNTLSHFFSFETKITVSSLRINCIGLAVAIVATLYVWQRRPRWLKDFAGPCS